MTSSSSVADPTAEAAGAVQSAAPRGDEAIIGAAVSRIDGPVKVSGQARYTSDRRLPGMLYAVPVPATIARGRITRIDSREAAAMPGVKAVFTRENIGRFYRISPNGGGKIDEKRPPLDDDVIRYYGQYVALVVAQSFEQASAAAERVKLSYQAEAPNVDMRLSPDEPAKIDSQRGAVDAAFAAAAVKLEQTYTTPPETHNPIELHSSVALWDGRAFTLYETTQAIVNHKTVLAQMLGVAPENMRVITEYLGAGFGGKLWPWNHTLLAAAAARNLQCPVKLVVSRKMMFQTVGHRTNTQQRIRMGANAEGRLVSLEHDYLYHVSRLDQSKENCGEATPYLYSTPNLRVSSAFSRRDIGANTSMRGPGAVPGLFALESAMDEMAIALKMDPVEFRIKNEPRIDESLNVPFSSRHLVESLRIGAQKFGWAARDPALGSMRRDGEILGWGVAACSWIAKRLPAQARVQLNADGTARVSSGTQDLGTGTYTVLAQMVASATGIDLSKIEVVIGDTSLPPGPMSGGSMATASLVPAVAQAVAEASRQALQAATAAGAPFAGAAPEALALTQARIHRKGESPQSGIPFQRALQASQLAHVIGAGKSGASGDDADAKKHSIHSYGAHFVEVGWQPAIARLRVKRVVTVIDGGKVLNTRTGGNQIEGAIVMGIGMALLEETHYDTRNGAPINSNLADYMMTTNADSPEIDVTFLDYPDLALNAMGARGIGEIGLAGFAAAVTSAVHHATGVRVRDLPVKIEDLLGSSVTA